MNLTGKWIDLIYRIATGSLRTRLIVAPIVAMCFFSFIAAFVLLSFMTDRFLGLPKISWHPWSTVTGAGFLIAGFFLMALSIAYFIRARGTPVPFSPPPKLITTGPYRFARNPMVTGIFMQLFGLGIACGSISLAFIFTPLSIAINVWELKKVEEPELVRRLGQDYVEYRKRVPMFFTFRVKG